MSELYPVILFYKYVPIADPVQFVADQRALCTVLGLKGRLLVATEGINGTLAGKSACIDDYVTELRSDPRFPDIEMKISHGDETTFPKLVVKVRPEIVTLKADVPLTADFDNHLSPAEWKRTIEEEDVVLVDVRNRYESVAGKFENAVECDIEQFRDLPAYVDEKLEGIKDRKVLMYCTGGIRCEKASALFRSKGFTNVYQLHGGIMTYQEQFGNEHWLGECFVFDNRMTVKVDDGLVQIGRCLHTGRPSARFVNCLHDLCHKLFILSEEAEQENSELRLCPECLAAGITSQTADYKGSPARAVAEGRV